MLHNSNRSWVSISVALSFIAIMLSTGSANAAEVTRSGPDLVALASYYDEDAQGCVRTAGSVIAVQRAVALPGAASNSELTVTLQRWSQCGDIQNPLTIVGFAYLQPGQFDISGRLGSATLDVLIPDASDWVHNTTVPLDIHLRWLNTGVLSSAQHYHQHQASQEAILNLGGSQRVWDADLTGSLSDGTTDYATALSPWQASLSTTSSVWVAVERARTLAALASGAGATASRTGGRNESAVATWSSWDDTGCVDREAAVLGQRQDSVPPSADSHYVGVQVYAYAYDYCSGTFLDGIFAGGVIPDGDFSVTSANLTSARLQTVLEGSTFDGGTEDIAIDLTWAGVGTTQRSQLTFTGINAGTRFTYVQRDAARTAALTGSLTDSSGGSLLPPGAPNATIVSTDLMSHDVGPH